MNSQTLLGKILEKINDVKSYLIWKLWLWFTGMKSKEDYWDMVYECEKNHRIQNNLPL